MQWEQADSPWELPAYIGDLLQDLVVTKAWIDASGPAMDEAMQLDNPVPKVTCEGKLEVVGWERNCHILVG